MAGEGVFPKSAGDIAYASEANRFAGAGKFIATGSFSVVSGTSYQTTGSILIGAGSVSNPCVINVDWRVNTTADSASAKVNFSGLSANFSIGSTTIRSDPYGTCRAMLGSPFACSALGISYGNTIVMTNQSADNFNSGSPFIISFDTLSQNACQIYYFINSEGRGY
jgi:hypothetical protein